MFRVKHLHYLLFTLVFTQGLVEYFKLPSYIYKVGVPFIIVVLISIKLFANEIKRLPFLFFAGIFIIISFISYLNSTVDKLSFIYFMVYTIFPYLYFIVLVNSDEEEEFSGVSNYLIFLILLQIPVSIIKYILLGQGEHGLIGTISTKAGSLSTIFPLFAISFLFAKYLFENRKIYMLYIIGFVLMGIIGEKRAIGIYTPLIMVVIYIVYKLKEGSLLYYGTLLNLFMVVLLGLMFFYITVRLNPGFNPDKKVWGRFDMIYVMEFTSKYVNKAPNKQELQRVAALQYFTHYLIKRGGIELMVGEGSGKLVESKLKSEGGTMMQQYGVRYGGRTSFVWLWLQTGILGVGTYLIFLLGMLFYLFRNYSNTYINLGLIGGVIIYLVDFLTYSNVFLKEFSIIVPFYFIMALHYNQVNDETVEEED
jgi:hypothetical protein